MVDMHYDLLTIAYICYLNDDYTMLKKVDNEIKNNNGNIKYIFANLCFTDKENMKNELNINYYQENVSVLEMFKISKKVLNKYVKGVKFIYCIEGCTYINIDELDDLYKEGLRGITLTWNDKNIYGSGIDTNSHLTNLGELFINKAINLGIGIDLSHTNENTFYDIVQVLQNNPKSIYYFSHSNIRKIEDRKRNLSDKQLNTLKNINCPLGIFSNKNFINKNCNSREELKLSYLKHIKYAVKNLGIDNVMLSTDDMRFCSSKNPIYNTLSIFNYDSLFIEIKRLLSKEFTPQEIEKIMYKNSKKIIDKLLT